MADRSLALGTLARLRRLEEEGARRALGEAAAREADAWRLADTAHDDRRREAAQAVSDPADPLAGAYAAWLPRATAAIAHAEAAAARCEADRLAALSALAERKAAVKAAQTIIDEHARLARRQQGKRAQSRLDELGQRLR